MSERMWYYLQNGNQTGPVAEAELTNLLQSGKLGRETMVWSESLSGWTPAAQVQALWPHDAAGAPGERQWYYMQGPAQAGPVPESELKRLLQSGSLPREAMVWSDNMEAWAPAATIAALAAAEGQVAAAAAAAAPGGTLTPSEIILLNPEQFAAEGTMLKGGSFQSLTSPAKAGHQELTTALLAAALLANEQAGNVRLTVVQKKAMLGLKTVNAVKVELVGDAVPWPQASFEWFIHEGVRKQPREAADLFTSMLLTNSQYPWSLASMICCASLAERGFLIGEEKKKLLVLKTVNYKVALNTAEAMAANPPAPVRQLLDQCRQCRPDLYQAIEQSVRTAISNQTEYSE
jgi:hypothetical protein